jgi:hypothetical protein
MSSRGNTGDLKCDPILRFDHLPFSHQQAGKRLTNIAKTEQSELIVSQKFLRLDKHIKG